MRTVRHDQNQGAQDQPGGVLIKRCVPLYPEPWKQGKDAQSHAHLSLLTSLKRGRGILLTSTGLLSAMLTNLASRIATAQETWTHLPKRQRPLQSPQALWLSCLCFFPQARLIGALL